MTEFVVSRKVLVDATKNRRDNDGGCFSVIVSTAARHILPKVNAMRSLILSCSLIAAIGIPLSASAQMNNGGGGGRTGSTGSTGMGGSSGFGSSGFGNAGSSGFGNSGSSFGSSGFGQGGMGSGGMGSTGMGGMGQNGMGMGGQQQGGNFLGANNNPNQFLGRGNTGQQGGMGQNGMMNQFGNNNRGGNRGNNLNTMNSMLGGMNGMNSGMNNRSQQVIRPRQRVAFDYPVPKTDTMHVNLKSQLERVAVRNPGMSNVLLSVDPSGELVLRGAVKSEADAKLAVNLVRLEPGVRSVRNELTFPPADGQSGE